MLQVSSEILKKDLDLEKQLETLDRWRLSQPTGYQRQLPVFYECRKQDLKFQNPLKSWNFIWDFPNICEFFMSQNKMNATFLEFWNFQFFPF